MHASELADLDSFDLVDIEVARLDRYFSGLPEDAARRPSRCAGWLVRDVLAHLDGEEMYNQACLNDDIPGFYARLQGEGVGGFYEFGDFNEWCVLQRRDLPLTNVLEEWRMTNADTRRRMRERGRDGTLQTSVGPYPAGLQAFHYASEYATHADDVGAPVQPHEEPGRTRWRARVGRFVLGEQGSPAEVEQVDDRYRVRVGNVTQELSASDFVTATVARLPCDHPLDEQLRDALACLA